MLPILPVGRRISNKLNNFNGPCITELCSGDDRKEDQYPGERAWILDSDKYLY